MNEKGFEGLKVWQKAHTLMLDIHKKLIPVILKIAPDEKYDLISQIRRASKSVPANIAEGHGRFIMVITSAFVITHVVRSMRRSII